MSVQTEAPPSDGSAPALRAEGLVKEFGGLMAVDGVSVDVPERSIVSMIGPNGAGKTTVFNMLTGLYKPTSGRIFLSKPRLPPSRWFQLAFVRGWAFHPLALVLAIAVTVAFALLPSHIPVVVPVLVLTAIVATDNRMLTGYRSRATTWLTLLLGPIGYLVHAWSRRRIRPETERDITRGRPDLITGMGVARTFQNIRLFAAMTAVENVMVGHHSRMRSGAIRSILRPPPLVEKVMAWLHRRIRYRWLRWIVRPPWVSREEHNTRERAVQLLSYVGLREEVHDQLASHLSYGDQRRIEIARALASEPRVLLLDEPTAGMNPHESAALTSFMRQLRDELGLSILLIEHDMKVVMDVSERVTVLDHGLKIAEGPPEQVRHDPRVIEAYLGTQQ